MSRKEFFRHNESFVCAKCKEENPSAQDTERNHCRKCLYSLHVDQETPGDRKSGCGSLMEPYKIGYKGAKGFMIVHRCLLCNKEIANRAASDDNNSLFNRFAP